MSRSSRLQFLVCVLLVTGAAGAAAQALPTAQPKYLAVYREQIKPGEGALHARTESRWSEANAKAKSTQYYLALASMTGLSEVWFMQPFESFKARGDAIAQDESDPSMNEEIARISAEDGAHLDGVRTLEAIAVPELSHGAFPNINLQRYWEITIFRVRPGSEALFAEAATAYQKLAQRALPKAAWRIYAVVAGMPGPTYLIVSSAQTMADFDVSMAEGMGAESKMTKEEKALFERFNREALISAETNRYRLDAGMSHVSAETKASDPKFWAKK